MSLDRLFDTVSAASRAANQTISMRRPDDWHVHLRDGAMLKAVLPFTAAQFARGIIMPNLVPPITTVEAAAAYRDRILAARPRGSDFLPFMTCYLTDEASPADIERGFSEKIWIAAKLYPAGATTNAHQGVSDLKRIASVLDRMEKIGMPLLVHAETTDPQVDIFDREAYFIENELAPLLDRHPGLKVVIEHATTAEAVDVVLAHAPRTAATITPHHLVINRTSLFQGGLRPHLYCLPVAKRERHRLALRRAATSGASCFFIGTDTAPHVRDRKEAECCSAGVFAAGSALQTYAQVFDEEEALDHFEAFASFNGACFYGLPINSGTVTLESEAKSLASRRCGGRRRSGDIPWRRKSSLVDLRSETMTKADIGLAVGRLLFKAKAINVNRSHPYVLAAGWASPVYIDVRVLFGDHELRHETVSLALKYVETTFPPNAFDVAAGAETAGIPFATSFADRTGMKLRYVRKRSLGIGRDAQVEGGPVDGLQVLLMDDLTTDGASKLGFARGLRAANAIVDHVVCIFYHDAFPGARKRLKDVGLELHALATWGDILRAETGGELPAEDRAEIERFLSNPVDWSARHGGRASIDPRK